jgi:hypothetical protein
VSEDGWLYQKAIEVALGVVKDFVVRRLSQKNDELLERKRKTLKYARPSISASELAQVALHDREAWDCFLTPNGNEVVSAVRRHVQRVRDWSSKIHFLDLAEDRDIHRSYVELDTYLVPVKLHVDELERERKLPFAEVLRTTRQHLAILGQPGAGKTTSMQKICFDLLNRSAGEGARTLPLLIRFRDLPPPSDSDTGVICRAMSEIFPLSLSCLEVPGAPKPERERRQLLTSAVLELVDRMGCAIILDGLDEYPFAAARENLIKELRYLACALQHARLIVTCRSGEFNYAIDRMTRYELAPLSPDQIKDFALRWLDDEREAADFLRAVMQTPFADTAIKPLSLAHLCALFKRTKKIPDKPKVVYRKIVGLLLEKWDEQRSVEHTSSYAYFEPDRKFEFLCRLAYEVTTRFQATVISHSMLIEIYESICHCFSLPAQEAQAVAREIESHTGLLVEAGFEKYEFAHKSIQEYLTAEHIVRLPAIPKDPGIVMHLGAELAIAISISSDPTLYLCSLAFQVLPGKNLGHSFYAKFFSRIVLEKPDLVRNLHATIALFSLPTLWLRGGVIDSADAYERLCDPGDVTQFRRYIRLLVGERDLAVLLDHYEISERKVAPNLIRCNIRRLGHGFKYPQYILAPIEFVPQLT